MYKLIKTKLINHDRSVPFQFSDQRLLAMACDNEVQIYKDVCTKPIEFPYMNHKVFFVFAPIYSGKSRSIILAGTFNIHLDLFLS